MIKDPKTLQPKDPLDARFGWSSVSSLRWLERVQETFWESRYGSSRSR